MAPHVRNDEIEADLAAAWPVVYNRLAGRFRDPQLADEVCSDALARAWEKWAESPGYFATHDLTAWSTRRGTWKALDQLRQRQRQRPLPDEQGEGEDRPTIRPRWEGSTLERERTHELVWACLQCLPAPERTALVAHHYEGLTDQAVGDVLFGQQGTAQARGLRVWRLRQRAYALLREQLTREGVGLVEEAEALPG